MSKPVKAMVTAELEQRYAGMESACVVDLTGLTVQAQEALRTALRDKSGRLEVVKNSLARQAFRDTVLEPLGKSLEGPCALVTSSESMIEIAKILVEAAKEYSELKLKSTKTLACALPRCALRGRVCEARAEVQQGEGGRARHAAVAVRRSGAHAFEQAEHTAQAGHCVERSHQGHLGRAGVGEADLDPRKRGGSHQALGPVHALSSRAVARSHLPYLFRALARETSLAGEQTMRGRSQLLDRHAVWAGARAAHDPAAGAARRVASSWRRHPQISPARSALR